MDDDLVTFFNQSRISWMIASRVPSMHLGGSRRALESKRAAGEVCWWRRSLPTSSVLFNQKESCCYCGHNRRTFQRRPMLKIRNIHNVGIIDGLISIDLRSSDVALNDGILGMVEDAHRQQERWEPRPWK